MRNCIAVLVVALVATARTRPLRCRRMGTSVALAIAVFIAPACSAGPEATAPPHSTAEMATDGSIAVANGSTFGVDWSLRGRRSDGVVCLELDDGSGGSGGECAVPVEPAGVRFGSQQAGQRTPIFVLGQVGKKAASVEVTLREGEPVEAELFYVSGFPVNAYVAVLPPGSRPTGVVARNRFGLKIASSS